MIDAILITGLPACGRSTLLAQLLSDLKESDDSVRCAVRRHRWEGITPTISDAEFITKGSFSWLSLYELDTSYHFISCGVPLQTRGSVSEQGILNGKLHLSRLLRNSLSININHVIMYTDLFQTSGLERSCNHAGVDLFVGKCKEHRYLEYSVITGCFDNQNISKWFNLYPEVESKCPCETCACACMCMLWVDQATSSEMTLANKSNVWRYGKCLP